MIRYESGKKAEIFTLVIKGTMEESWFNNSSAENQYIELSEQELDEVLDGFESTNLVQEAKETDLLFRF